MNDPGRQDLGLVDDNRAATLLKAALGLRCAVCKRGKAYPRWNRYADACPVCGMSVNRDQGFFLGSIYVNYGLTASIVLVAWFGSGAAFRPVDLRILLPLVAFCVVFPLWFLRYARALFAATDQYFDPRRPPPPTSVD